MWDRCVPVDVDFCVLTDCVAVSVECSPVCDVFDFYAVFEDLYGGVV